MCIRDSGTGIVIKNSGSTVGTAGTINFGDNLSVSSISGGAVTITASTGDPTDSDVQVAYTVTAPSASYYRMAGNGIDSSTNNPTLYLYRDTKYRFIHNAGGSHPLQLRTSAGGSAYTDGVTYSESSNNYTTQGNNFDFSPQHDAPSTLVYQCTIHGGMVGTINIVDFAASNSRTVVSGTTGSLANNAIGNISVTGFKSYLLMNVGLSTACLLYTSPSPRD